MSSITSLKDLRKEFHSVSELTKKIALILNHMRHTRLYFKICAKLSQ